MLAMAFWGIEVKPGKPYTHRYDEERGRLQLSLATLGSGSSTKKNILQCQVGNKKPINLCSLLPDKMETCTLNLEFEEEEEVIFSVQGPQSIHLSGFFIGEPEEPMRDAYESDSYGEDISGTESDYSSNYDSEEGFGGEFSDDDVDMYPSSPVPNSGVVIEEIVDDDKPATDNGTSKKGKKKKQLSTSANNNSETQLVVKGSTEDQILESEDEDGFPIMSTDKNKADALSIKENMNEAMDKKSNEETKQQQQKDKGSVRSLKRKVEAVVGDKEDKSGSGQQPASSAADAIAETGMKQKKKNKKKKTNNEEAMQLGDEGHSKQSTEKNISIDANSSGEDKKKNKKKKQQAKEAEVTADQAVANTKEPSKEKTKGKSQVRTFPNGLVIEEVAMGKPDGKKASPGKKVSVHYIGKLKKNGEIFDSNIGRAPFKFRLGVGQVIKGWDVGVNGMRVGDKRRLTIPPAMGYGSQGAGKAIPPNAWLVFDVELVAVN